MEWRKKDTVAILILSLAYLMPPGQPSAEELSAGEKARITKTWIPQLGWAAGYRTRATKQLVEIGPPVVPCLIEGLKNDSVAVRFGIGRVFASLGPFGLKSLSDTLFNTDKKIVEGAVDAISAAGPAMVDPLFQCLRGDATNDALIAEALTGIGLAAVPGLQRIRGSDRNATVLIDGVLSRIAVNAVQDETWRVYYEEPDVTTRLFKSVIGGVNDSCVRYRIAVALAELRDPAGVPVLIQAVKDAQQTGFVRFQAAWALGLVPHKSAVPSLLEALHDPDAGVRRAAAKSLGYVKDPAGIRGLEMLANGDDRALALTAVWAIREIRGENR